MGDHRLADRQIDLFSTPPDPPTPPPSLHSAAFYVYIFAFDYGGYSDMSRANVLICRRVREQRHGLRQFWGVVWGWGGAVGYLSHWDPTPSL